MFAKFRISTSINDVYYNPEQAIFDVQLAINVLKTRHFKQKF